MIWPVERVKNVADLAIGPFGSALKAELYVSEGVPVVAGGNLGNGRWPDLMDAPRVSRETAQRLARSVARPGDLIFPHRGSIGRVGIADRDLLLSTSMMRARFNADLVLPQFAYWYFLAEGSRELLTMASSVGTPGIGQPLSSLGSVPIKVPPMEVQLGMVEVLGALEDKIVANRVTASSIADVQRAHWEASGRDRRLIPLAAVASPHLGGTPDRRDSGAWSGPVRWASVRDLTAADHGVLLSTVEMISAEISRSARRLGQLPEGTVVLTARGTVGHVTVLGVPAAINQSAYAFIPPAGGRVALRLGIESLAASLRRRAHGSVFSTITMETLQGAMIPDFFDGSSEPVGQGLEILEDLRVAALKENLRLAATRDELLPLLMSGKATVKEAENTIEEVV